MEQKEQVYKIMAKYVVKAFFEISIDACGSNFLIIYGAHVNGYFCAIPNWKISCEMSDPTDVFYNREKLIGTGINLSEKTANEIALAIREQARI